MFALFIMFFVALFVAFMVLLVSLPPADDHNRMKTYEELLKETRERIEKERHLTLVKKEEDGQTNSKTNN